MVDQEVVEIFDEIRNRVRAGVDPQSNSKPQPPVAGASTVPASHPTIMTRSFSGLSVLGRAWDRLPPLVSNRSGSSARFELWIKRQLKRALRWFTWEQVNFNAATHQTFREIVETLAALERNSLNLQAQLETLQAEFKTQNAETRSALENLRREQGNVSQLEAQLTRTTNTVEAARNEVQARVAELTMEVRERDERLLDEQRVCFKQLSLEANEALALHERLRRQIELRLEKLEREKE